MIVKKSDSKIKGGMSGSPILDSNGAAVALISTGDVGSGMHPTLMDCLPGWLLAKMKS